MHSGSGLVHTLQKMDHLLPSISLLLQLSVVDLQKNWVFIIYYGVLLKALDFWAKNTEFYGENVSNFNIYQNLPDFPHFKVRKGGVFIKFK